MDILIPTKGDIVKKIIVGNNEYTLFSRFLEDYISKKFKEPSYSVDKNYHYIIIDNEVGYIKRATDIEHIRGYHITEIKAAIKQEVELLNNYINGENRVYVI